MKTDQQRACPQHIPVATLSAWRDGDLSHVKADRLRAHITDCVACQQTIAAYTTLGRALQRGLAEGQHESSRRQDRLWRALRARILWQQGGQWMNTTQTRIWRGVGAAAIALVVAVVAFQLLGDHMPHMASEPRVTTTATKQQTPAPLDPAIARLPTLTQAWGTHAITSSQPVGQSSDGNPDFTPVDIAPDGTVVIGLTNTSYQSTLHTSIEALTVATGKIQQLANVTYTADANTSILFPGVTKTDGNYIAWTNQTSTAWQIVIYDVRHATQTILQSSQSVGEIFRVVALDHGQLFWLDQRNGLRKSYALEKTDLGTNTTIDIVPQGVYGYLNAEVSWPYIFYNGVSNSPLTSSTDPVNSAFLYNLTTQKQITLSSSAIDATNNYFLAGTTLYKQQQNSQNTNAALEVDQLQHADQSGTAWQKLVTLPWTDDYVKVSNTSLQAVNNRLLIFGRGYAATVSANLIAWDTAQQRLILIDSAMQAITLHGDWLAYLSANTATTYTLHVINTAQLP